MTVTLAIGKARGSGKFKSILDYLANSKPTCNAWDVSQKKKAKISKSKSITLNLFVAISFINVSSIKWST